LFNGVAQVGARRHPASAFPVSLMGRVGETLTEKIRFATASKEDCSFACGGSNPAAFLFDKSTEE
jgi:hypothetical protein